jgi:hypothetical protein
MFKRKENWTILQGRKLLMKKRFLVSLLIGISLISMSGWVLAAKPKLGEITPGTYQLQPITNHIPWAFDSYEAAWNIQQKVELEIGKQDQFKDLPKLGMKEPYTGVIKLGDKDQKFGVIIDVVGEEKRLYIDRDGDNSFAGETWSPLLNEWYGLQIYGVYGPEPIQLNVNYQSQSDQAFPMLISVNGLLNKPGAFLKDKPYLRVAVQTWFLARIVEDGASKLVAIVDQTNNGRYNDPEDLLFIDYNDDGRFEKDEAIPRSKKGITITSGKAKLAVNWTVYPDKLVIGGGKNNE